MKIRPGLQIISLIFCFLQLFVSSKAQDGNHCGVRKSSWQISIDSGKKVYVFRCMSCHQENRMAISNVNLQLIGKNVIGDKNKLIEAAIDCSSRPGEINDTIYNIVPIRNTALSDKEIADVLTYIGISFGNKASAIKVSEVKSTRDKLNSYR
jgi:mono/diheme cytochrome c family protein